MGKQSFKEAKQRTFFLLRLKKLNLPQTLMVQFYTAITDYGVSHPLCLPKEGEAAAHHPLGRRKKNNRQPTGCSSGLLQQGMQEENRQDRH